MKKLMEENLRRVKGANNSAVLLLGAAIVIVVILIALIAFLLLKGGSKGVGGASNLASYFPQDTLIYAELNITEEKLKTLQKLSGDAFTLEKMAEGIKHAINNPSDTIEAVELLDELSKTLEPIGAMGMWGMDATTSQPEKVLLAAVVKDPDNVAKLFEKASDGNTTFSPKSIDGLDYYISDKTGGYVVFDNTLLMSDKVETLQEAIALHKDKKDTVLSNSEAKNVLENLPPERFFTMLINTATINKMTANTPGMKLGGDNETMQQIFETMSYVGMGIDLHNDVLEGKFYAPYSLESITNPEMKANLGKIFVASSKLDAPKALPGDTFMFVSLSGVSYYIQTITQTLEPSKREEYTQFKNMVKQFTKLEVETDILPLFAEEFTFGARCAGTEVDPIIVLTAKPESMQVLNKLVSTLTMFDPSASTSQKDLGGSTFSIISSSQSPFDLAFGEVTDVITLGKASTLETVADAVKNPDKSLAKSSIYKDLSTYVPQKVSFAMFINFDKLVEASKAMKQNPDKIKELEKMSENMSAMIFSATNKDGKSIEGNFLVKFKGKNNQ
ncbi:MAG: DUF3352 domain-containing protein [Cyanobacteriota bacterium]